MPDKELTGDEAEQFFANMAKLRNVFGSYVAAFLVQAQAEISAMRKMMFCFCLMVDWRLPPWLAVFVTDHFPERWMPKAVTLLRRISRRKERE